MHKQGQAFAKGFGVCLATKVLSLFVSLERAERCAGEVVVRKQCLMRNSSKSSHICT